MNHYYKDNRHLKENRKEITFRFWCFDYKLVLDDGVFAKDGVDLGTRVLLETILDSQEISKKVLDVGCGYGVIGMIIKNNHQDSQVQMIDVNQRALNLAKINLKNNNLTARVYYSDCYSEVRENDFTDIITNPPIRAGKQIVYEIFVNSYNHLVENGSLWVVIRKQHGANSAIKKIIEVFGNCAVINRNHGFWVLRAVKQPLDI